MKIKLYYYWYHPSWETEGTLDIWTRNVTDAFDDRVFIKTEEVDIPDCGKPDQRFISTALTTRLQAEKAAILAETHKKVSAIDERISQLQALEYQGGA